jgi:ubiquinone/menaquinone biosynthesis C-methylase UbiE
LADARDPKQRFSDRVDDYVRYRPGYPRGVVDLLVERCGLGQGRAVADVGSGTGIFSRLLLDAGARVYAVEPNAPMRAAAEKALGDSARFHSVPGSAEATTLPAASVELATAAQAFHWFDATKARAELARILKPGGFVALVWNQRKDSPFNDDYERMLADFAPEYANVNEKDRAAEPKIRAFYAPAAPEVARFDHEQLFDEQGLRGRLTSSSYAPQSRDPAFPPMMKRLGEIFAKHARKGKVAFPYEAVVWYGRLA